VIESPLPRDRDLMRLRHDPRYMKMTAELWDLITPSLAGAGAS
jgi:NitT/TauT family transport system ATP-binding protein